MKRLALILTSLAFTAGTALAQPHGPHHGPPGPPSAEHVEQMLDHLTQALGLTDAQRAALEKIHEARRAKLEPLMAKMTAAHQQVEAALARDADDATVGKLVKAAYKVRKQLEVLHDEMQKEAEKVLDAKQLEKFRAMMAMHKGGMGPH